MVEQWTVLVICQISIGKICNNVIKCVIREDIIVCSCIGQCHNVSWGFWMSQSIYYVYTIRYYKTHGQLGEIFKNLILCIVYRAFILYPSSPITLLTYSFTCLLLKALSHLIQSLYMGRTDILIKFSLFYSQSVSGKMPSNVRSKSEQQYFHSNPDNLQKPAHHLLKLFKLFFMQIFQYLQTLAYNLVINQISMRI